MAIAAGNLSELWLTLGEVAQAVKAARQSVEFADRSEDGFQRESERTALADALHQTGKLLEAEKFFREAEQMRKERQGYTYLYSLAGFRFCDLLLSLGQYQEVQQRAAQTLEWGTQQGLLLDIALDRLSLGRAFLLQSFDSAQDDRHGERSRTIAQAAQYLDQAVAGFRESGDQDFLARGLLDRAVLFRVTHQFDKAWTDLNEAHEIAVRGEMRLWLVDYHLEACRLISEQLSVISNQSSVISYQSSGANGEVSWEAAREHVEKAAELVEKTGYHRRDRELEELRTMLENDRNKE